MARIGKFFFFDGSENLATVFYYHVRSNGGVVESIGCVDNTSSFLEQSSFLLSPSGYKEDTVYTQKPIGATGNLTFTRGSDSWRTNVQGLVERTPYNLLQRSEEFDNGIWTKTGCTISTNVTSAPNGTTTADKLVSTNLATGSSVYQQGTIIANASYTFSIYVKASGANWIQLIATGTTISSPARLWVDLSNGALGTNNGGFSIASVTNVGDGWYRVIGAFTTASTATFSNLFCALATGDNINAFSGDGTSGVFIWGAQLVEGAYPLEYFPTTDRLDVPRIDYSYGTCPALLLEPQRTNLCLYSSAVGGTGWTIISAGTGVSPTVTTNYAVSPDGTMSASRLQLSLNGGTTTLDQSLVTQTLTGTSCRGSFYIKTNDGSTKTIYVRGSSAYSIVIDGTWKRYDFDAATLSTTQFGIGLRGGQTPTNSNTADILVWGAQLEAGAYPSSYIRTEATTVTRLADSFSRNNIYTNNLITSAGGTWYVELRGNLSLTQATSEQGISLGDNSVQFLGNQLQIRSLGGNARLTVGIRISGSYFSLYATTSDTVKLAFKWNGSTADVFVNGTKVVTATSFTATALEFLTATATGVPKYIQGMALYPVPLDDVDCELLTNPTSSGYSSFASMASSLGYILI